MLDPIAAAPIAVQIHVAGVLLAMGLAPVQLWRKGGGHVHKTLGYLWVIAMAVTALSSFWIQEIRLLAGFSPIHLLSLWVLYTLFASIRAARRGDIAAHRAWLGHCAFWALGVTGVLTLIPGRRMSTLLFTPDTAWLGFAGAVLAVAAITFVLRRRMRARPLHLPARLSLRRRSA